MAINRPMRGMPSGFPSQPVKNKKKNMARLLKYLMKHYKWMYICVIVSIVISSLAGIGSTVFLRFLVDDCIMPGLTLGFGAVYQKIINNLAVVGIIYIAGIVSAYVNSLLMSVIGPGFLKILRLEMFSKMQRLPIKYFDTHTHGDIMSRYTNDVDSLRQLISQSLPQMLSSALTLIALTVIMLSYSLWLSLIVFGTVYLMMAVIKKIGGNSAKYFIKQQASLGKTEGYIEETMHGQKVVKVFNHEDEALAKFDELNNRLCKDAESANRFSNILMPIIGNLGIILYILLAFIGAALVIGNVPNVCLTGINLLSIGTIVSFLMMSRMFSMSISQVSQQINFVAAALAGADRVFTLLDETPEKDEGYVTLVNASVDKNGNITESGKRTGLWAWKHPHKADGTVTYTPLKGTIQLQNVDFGYEENKTVLHDVTINAQPGQKIAFVGATGAGKTTITNLINRFYDIADGKIRYDGININKIKKPDLRRSLAVVLQDTNLFTGTVMENIRYGKLDASDEECIEAAKLANAHDFITRLPDGYNTVLTSDGANLSQGQRQLLSIARAAVADAPVLIMDEATSSIDTRTEALVQKGTDRLMKGRTVFVIAHRLSTVQNSDVIIVLDQGKIIEQGSHKELIENKGRYYRLYTGAFELE